MGNRTNGTTPLFLSEKQMNLLCVAEQYVYSDECENYCIHFNEGVYPCECSHFSCGEGYLTCDGYKQKGGTYGD